MATDYIELVDREVTPLREQAKGFQDAYQRQSSEIARDPYLSEDGRKQQTTELRDSYRTQLKALRARETTIISDRITSIERLVFGTPSSSDPSAVISFRDAQERAERLGEDDTDAAKTLLNRAERTSDRNLAEAILRVAVERGWRSVINEYESRHPGSKSDLNALVELRGYLSDGFGRTLAYAII